MMERFALWLMRKAHPGGRFASLMGMGAPGRNVSYQSLADEGMKANSDVYACITEISLGLGGIPLIVYRKRGKGRREWEPIEDENHPLVRLLAHPNPVQSWDDMLDAMVCYLLLSGCLYLHAPGARPNAPIRELWPIRPDWLTPKPYAGGEKKNEVEWYEYREDGTGASQRLSADEVMALWLFDPLKACTGLSPLVAAATEIDQGNKSRTWNLSLLINSGRPPGVLTLPEGVSPDVQVETQLKKQVRRDYSGPDNAGKIPILAGGFDWKPMGFSPAEMEWIEGLKLSTRKICAVLRVPPEIIGDHENATYSNYQESRKAYYHECLLPLLKRIRGKFNQWLVPHFGSDLWLDYDPGQIEALQEDRQKVWDNGLRAYQAGAVTRNEFRAMVSLPADADGDAFLMPIMAVLVPGRSATKSINLPDDQAREMYWKGVDRRRERLVIAMGRIVGEAFNDERKAVEVRLRSMPTPESGIDAAMSEIGKRADEWLATYRRVYLVGSRPFFDAVQEDIKALRGVDEMKAAGDLEDVWLNATEDYLSLTAATKITGVLDTTKLMVRAALDQGVVAGEGIPDLARRLRETYDGFGKVRSVMIARTEVVAASNFGSQAGAQATGLDLTKRWLSTPDERTREDHREANGQERALDDPYEVGGERLMFPGDNSLGASGGQVINCRCTETYEVEV